jgi:hypothetical protein
MIVNSSICIFLLKIEDLLGNRSLNGKFWLRLLNIFPKNEYLESFDWKTKFLEL